MLRELKCLASEVRFDNSFWQYKIDRYTKPNGNEGDYHYVHSHGAVMIVPQLPDGRFLMTKQYRYLNRRESLEFPGGALPLGRDAATQAQNELREETGYAAAALEPLGLFNPMNGITDEICAAFFARGLRPGGAPHDDTEEFEVLALSFEEINEAIRRRVIWDGMTMAIWQLFLLSPFFEAILP